MKNWVKFVFYYTKIFKLFALVLWRIAFLINSSVCPLIDNKHTWLASERARIFAGILKNPLDSDLSVGKRYPSFEQLGHTGLFISSRAREHSLVIYCLHSSMLKTLVQYFPWILKALVNGSRSCVGKKTNKMKKKINRLQVNRQRFPTEWKLSGVKPKPK